MKFNALFSKEKLGDLSLPHRIVMAPLTRSRSSQPGDIPNDMNVEYYKQCSTAALIITEATQISPQGKGYAFTPGIHSKAQIQGWKKITDKVHNENGRIFMQLWHVGRVSHSSLQRGNAIPVAPSAIAVDEGQAFTYEGMKDFETPRALELNELPDIVEQYRLAAINAKQAGFDGVEIHAANGYLLDQFLKDGTNKRDDIYGGSIENRIRLVMEVIKVITDVWGGSRVGIRISPTGTFNSMSESKPQELYNHLVEKLNQFNLAYLHVVEDFANAPVNGFNFNVLRKKFNGAYMANGSYTAETAERSLKNKLSDFVAFGVPFIANPDLPKRLRLGAELNQADPTTFYGGDAKGYID
ncbi:MAG TPA: alkene reductase [Thiotrichaceae bacterium]|jgi:N-ethylmaleimide reductase|nr:alkene reductase [Thiotrichaceae bacterium]